MMNDVVLVICERKLHDIVIINATDGEFHVNDIVVSASRYDGEQHSGLVCTVQCQRTAGSLEYVSGVDVLDGRARVGDLQCLLGGVAQCWHRVWISAG
jgi:hypothetical protein